MIFQEKPENGNICALSSVLDAAQATVWGTSAGVTLPGGGSGWLRREPLAAAPGDREPRPGREQGKGLRLGHQVNGGSSPSTLCAKGLEKALVTQKVGLGATASPPQTPGREVPPFLLPLETSLCGHLSAPPPACPSSLQGTWRPSANRPSPDPSSPLGIFFKLEFCFLKKLIYFHVSESSCSEKPYIEPYNPSSLSPQLPSPTRTRKLLPWTPRSPSCAF